MENKRIYSSAASRNPIGSDSPNICDCSSLSSSSTSSTMRLQWAGADIDRGTFTHALAMVVVNVQGPLAAAAGELGQAEGPGEPFAVVAGVEARESRPASLARFPDAPRR